MKVIVHLHTILQRQTPDGPIDRLELGLPDGSDLTRLLRELEIDLNPDSLLLVVNGRVAGIDQPLMDGDEVNLMPAISGGSIRMAID